MADIKSESIALAALFQCCTQIQRVATTGYYDENAVSCVMRAVFVTNPKTVEDIYDPAKLVVGFKQLTDSLGKSDITKTADTIVITKMALKVITLANNIERNEKINTRLSEKVDELADSILQDNPDLLDSDVSNDTILSDENIRNCGHIYQSLISPNFAKLIIYGEERFLRNTENQDKIRALLLCAIRAVVLWRQVGGKRRYLIFRRKDILEYAQNHS
ncbi:MAG: lysogenization protein HflD [Succinivibrio sp.]